MASITLSLVDPNNGIVTTTYNFADQDIQRLYKSYKELLTPELTKDEIEQGKSTINISTKNISDYLLYSLIQNIRTATYNQECKVLCKDLQFINISERS